MNRIILTFIIAISCLGIGVNSLAQEYETTGLNFGVKAGLNFSNLVGDDAQGPDGEDWEYKAGAIGGLFVNYTFADMFAVQPELLFSMKGAKLSADVAGTEVDYKQNLNYLEVPVLLKLMPARNSAFKPEIYAGPAVGFLLSAKSKAEGGTLGDVEVDIKDSLKSVDFGVTAGAGISYLVGSSLLGLDARYTAGLTKIDDTAAESDVKNSDIAIFLNYTFSLGRSGDGY